MGSGARKVHSEGTASKPARVGGPPVQGLYDQPKSPARTSTPLYTGTCRSSTVCCIDRPPVSILLVGFHLLTLVGLPFCSRQVSDAIVYAKSMFTAYSSAVVKLTCLRILLQVMSIVIIPYAECRPYLVRVLSKCGGSALHPVELLQQPLSHLINLHNDHIIIHSNWLCVNRSKTDKRDSQ